MLVNEFARDLNYSCASMFWATSYCVEWICLLYWYCSIQVYDPHPIFPFQTTIEIKIFFMQVINVPLLLGT